MADKGRGEVPQQPNYEQQQWQGGGGGRGRGSSVPNPAAAFAIIDKQYQEMVATAEGVAEFINYFANNPLNFNKFINTPFMQSSECADEIITAIEHRMEELEAAHVQSAHQVVGHMPKKGFAFSWADISTGWKIAGASAALIGLFFFFGLHKTFLGGSFNNLENGAAAQAETPAVDVNPLSGNQPAAKTPSVWRLGPVKNRPDLRNVSGTVKGIKTIYLVDAQTYRLIGIETRTGDNSCTEYYNPGETSTISAKGTCAAMENNIRIQRVSAFPKRLAEARANQ